MWLKNDLKDTICALSTPQGRGAIHLIRLSGEKALNIVRKICPNLPKKLCSHNLYYKQIIDPINKINIDDVLISYFVKGKSFTGEEVVEISCHGNNFISSKIIDLLVFFGAKTAERGEFSFRAFINKKIDLIQAESILTLIESSSDEALEISNKHLKGGLSKKIDFFISSILDISAQIEATIDFPEEEIEELNVKNVIKKTEQISKKILNLLNSYKSGKFLNEKINVVICGKPNVGKSSLLNSLVKKDRAIVTDQPGTTRDVVEAFFKIKDKSIKISDTAGIRESRNIVEALGIKKTSEEIKKADYILFVFDLSETLSKKELIILDKIKKIKQGEIVFVANKKDKVSGLLEEKIKKTKDFFGITKSEEGNFITCNALNQKGVLSLLMFFERNFAKEIVDFSGVIVNNRHYELLKKSQEHLNIAIDSLKNNFIDCVIFDLKEALNNLYYLIGKNQDPDILDSVFSNFCIGK